ncbi:Luminescence regulatory protein LuxO [Thalassocella blandensis]|nr:Luminescence regulatory protein LuxO [Thalassocella blandensis]
MANILLVDDDEGFRSATSELLGLLGHNVKQADTVASASEQLREHDFDRILLDLMLPDGSGLHVLEVLAQSEKSDTNVTVITGHPAVKSLVKSLYGPRVNYLIKPISLDQLRSLVEEDDYSSDSEKSSAGVNGVEKHLGFLIGESKPMKELYEMITRVASTNANVLLMGESGVGKEVVANAIHHISGCSGEFVAANCGAFARELISSELFGHEKGAFTGAISRKAGVFEQALNGTLFLDEITEMPLDLQPNLLRVLETNTVTRLGSTKSSPVSCRVVSATNRSEDDFAQRNCLREDLYFRLAVFPIKIPSLRERIDDIPLLSQNFITELNDEHGTSFKLSDESLAKLREYNWPGNVRELRHTMHRAFIMTNPESEFLKLPSTIGSPFDGKSSSGRPRLEAGRTIEDVERELIQVTLEQLEGDKKKAAEMLGISLKTLYNRINEYQECAQS